MPVWLEADVEKKRREVCGMRAQPVENSVYVGDSELRRFMEQALESLGVPEEDARISADVLLEADLRGIDTHGIGRLSIYVGRLKAGTQAQIGRAHV